VKSTYEEALASPPFNVGSGASKLRNKLGYSSSPALLCDPAFLVLKDVDTVAQKGRRRGVNQLDSAGPLSIDRVIGDVHTLGELSDGGYMLPSGGPRDRIAESRKQPGIHQETSCSMSSALIF